jgi:diacylglycerol kinase family enzyme
MSARDGQSASRRWLTGRERFLALCSLGSALALVAVVIVFCLHNLGSLVFALAGVAIAIAGLWWVATERGIRRGVGVLVGAAGATIVVLALLHSTPSSDRPLIRLLVSIALFGASAAFGRAAIGPGLHEREVRRPVPVRPPRHPVLICNPWSGGGKVAQFGLAELAKDRGVDVIMLDHGLDLERLARSAVADGADCLGMAGGDGSQALVASIAVEHDLPFVCVSAGTRNHFALDLGIDRVDPRLSLDAFTDGIERRIDYATVGERFFVNNVSLGIYATIVQSEGYREAKAETTKAMLPEMLGQTQEPFDLQFTDADGVEIDGAFLIQVSNNPYALGVTLDASQRRQMDTGTLGVVAISARSGSDAAEVFTLSLLGQRRRSRYWHEFSCTSFEVRSRSGKAYAGVDGEALELPTPLEFQIHPGGLKLLVPMGNLTNAERRSARDVSVRDLVSIARGIDPLTGSRVSHTSRVSDGGD